jgi:hypothetical protein
LICLHSFVVCWTDCGALPVLHCEVVRSNPHSKHVPMDSRYGQYMDRSHLAKHFHRCVRMHDQDNGLCAHRQFVSWPAPACKALFSQTPLREQYVPTGGPIHVQCGSMRVTLALQLRACTGWQRSCPLLPASGPSGVPPAPLGVPPVVSAPSECSQMLLPRSPSSAAISPMGTFVTAASLASPGGGPLGPGGDQPRRQQK